MSGMRLDKVLVKSELPPPSLVVLSAVVGFGEVFHETPLADTGESPVLTNSVVTVAEVVEVTSI